MAESGRPFVKMTRWQMACVPFLVLWPALVYYFPKQVPILLTLGVYLIVCEITRCVRIGLYTLVGLWLGHSLDPLVKGGGYESQMWETVRYLATGTGIGLLVGVALQESARYRERNPVKPPWEDGQEKSDTEA